ncbi:hypothetical protein [Methanosarcina siciliae]|uniref:hypothetical protein n=1 Tax=Methanosarcina siciliae TaxID=38027 RepID=UPI000ADB8DD9|nr:hypothetical protein [Methanosarcina siciliae]
MLTGNALGRFLDGVLTSSEIAKVEKKSRLRPSLSAVSTDSIHISLFPELSN